MSCSQLSSIAVFTALFRSLFHSFLEGGSSSNWKMDGKLYSFRIPLTNNVLRIGPRCHKTWEHENCANSYPLPISGSGKMAADDVGFQYFVFIFLF